MPTPSTFVLTFCPVLSSTAPVKNGAQLILDGSTASLDGRDRSTNQQTAYSGQVTTRSASTVATFTTRDGKPLDAPLVFESFPIAVSEGRVMVGAFYEDPDKGPGIPPDDVGSYVAIEPDTDDD